MDQRTKEFYLRLREELATTSNWPTIYLYKFIVPTDPSKIKQVEDAFNNMGAVINTIQSKNGNFTSLSVNVKMDNPDHVIEKYLEVSNVEGIISL
jgi:putative lipoic acid-binding regulatory protein